MKAPDKVFVYCDYEGNPDKVDIYPLGKNSIEYIRKNALLEWAKECFRLQECESWYSKGAADAFRQIIEKLNSM